jgi:hypothetical protein
MRRAHRFEIPSMERPATFLVQFGAFAALGGMAAAFWIAWRRGGGWGWGVAVAVLGLLALLQCGIVVGMLAQPAHVTRGLAYYDWMLKVHVEAPGPDLERTYFIPVRAGG